MKNKTLLLPIPNFVSAVGNIYNGVRKGKNDFTYMIYTCLQFSQLVLLGHWQQVSGLLREVLYGVGVDITEHINCYVLPDVSNGHLTLFAFLFAEVCIRQNAFSRG